MLFEAFRPPWDRHICNNRGDADDGVRFPLVHNDNDKNERLPKPFDDDFVAFDVREVSRVDFFTYEFIGDLREKSTSLFLHSSSGKTFDRPLLLLKYSTHQEIEAYLIDGTEGPFLVSISFDISEARSGTHKTSKSA